MTNEEDKKSCFKFVIKSFSKEYEGVREMMMIQGREIIVRIKNKTNEPSRKITSSLEVVKSANWCILKDNECTGQLSYAKEPERPQRTKCVMTELFP